MSGVTHNTELMEGPEYTLLLPPATPKGLDDHQPTHLHINSRVWGEVSLDAV